MSTKHQLILQIQTLLSCTQITCFLGYSSGPLIRCLSPKTTPLYEARFQVPWDSKILVNCPSWEIQPLYHCTKSELIRGGLFQYKKLIKGSENCTNSYCTVKLLISNWNKKSLKIPNFKGVIRICKSKKDRQHYAQKKKDKRTNNELLNTTQKTTDRETRTPRKTGSKFEC